MDNKTEPLNEDTRYAPSGKASGDEIIKQYDELSGNQLIRMISDAIPDVAMILSKERQVVYENKALMELAGESATESFLGKRPGEILDCLNARSEGNGCGTTESCRYCGAINAILECQRTGLPSNRECRISAGRNGQSFSYDLQVNASPFSFNGREYVIFSVKDISDQKRRKVLERMFFHDVLNNASGLNGMLLAIKGASNPEEMKEYIDIAEKASNDLIEDLMSQRALSAAESGDLMLKVVRYSSVAMLNEISAYLTHHEIARDKRIFIDPFSHSVQIETDQQLLKRVLINLVKNALEASPPDSIVTLGSRVKNKTICFWVNNPAMMPEEVQKQIFQRSFSTKGSDRGIGTYSVKLLTTKYLKGKVEFETNETEGTTFRIQLPLGI
ncbi:MAG: HAMP domain-containing histidine kinase [Bacteroidales bacterium]|nr:HAMP domain-containing histidine kinase [Bacteroidales bacterium]